LGSLGFLLPFGVTQYEKTLSTLLTRELKVLVRRRLEGSVDGIVQGNAMNELVLHRGSEPHLTNIKCFVNGIELTHAIVWLFSINY
jgi:NADH kinase